MVLIQINRGTTEFIIESKCSANVNELSKEVGQIFNQILKIQRLTESVNQLIQFGPMKPADQRGLSEEQLNLLGDEQKTVPGADPLGIRVGIAPPDSMQNTLRRAVGDAEATISNNKVKQRQPISQKQLDEAYHNLVGAVKMTYPEGLPEDDITDKIINDAEDLQNHEHGKLVVEPEKCVLWFAGKCLDRSLDKPVSQFIGSNEKMFIKTKLEQSFNPANGSGPARNQVDAETQAKIASYWHKQQALNKALNESETSADDYLNSEWANPNHYKQKMNGIGEIRFSGR